MVSGLLVEVAHFVIHLSGMYMIFKACSVPKNQGEVSVEDCDVDET